MISEVVTLTLKDISPVPGNLINGLLHSVNALVAKIKRQVERMEEIAVEHQEMKHPEGEDETDGGDPARPINLTKSRPPPTRSDTESPTLGACPKRPPRETRTTNISPYRQIHTDPYEALKDATSHAYIESMDAVTIYPLEILAHADHQRVVNTLMEKGQYAAAAAVPDPGALTVCLQLKAGGNPTPVQDEEEPMDTSEPPNPMRDLCEQMEKLTLEDHSPGDTADEGDNEEDEEQEEEDVDDTRAQQKLLEILQHHSLLNTLMRCRDSLEAKLGMDHL